jgi:signal transduction histidine kinase
MKLQLKERALTIAVVVTTIVIIVFAALQYRWSREISNATGVRLADTLLMSIVNWQIDLERNVSEIGRALGPASGGDENLAEHARQFESWKARARYPDLVNAVYVVDAATTRAERLNEATQTFERVDWPSGVVSGPEVLTSGRDVPRPTGGTRPLDETRPVAQPAAWRFEPGHPALLRPIAGSARWLVVSLNPDVIRQRILPELAHRYFQGTDGLDYEVAVVAGQSPGRVLYASDPGFGSDVVADADGTLNIFGRGLDGSESPMEVFHKTPLQKGSAATAMSWFPLMHDDPPAQDWRLIVRHRRGGPLGAFLADTQRRDLVMSFGALLLLVASIAMLVVTSHRAQRLAALQMDFVTTVSHELRTPLTVISSAADNIAQGVVQGRDQLTQYGSVIGNQVRQLSALVEQILLFATHTRKPQRFTLEPLAVAEVIDATVGSTEGLIRAAHFDVDRDIEADMPPVMGDKVALMQCLQNLLTNALKYGRDQRWIGIRARAVHGENGRREIQIAISDRGIGITAADLPHIFEPFYRSPAVAGAQIHGTGLGLSLAKGIADMMGGRITVASEPGRGSVFTLHLPCADPPQMGVGLELGASPAQRL